jgi:hypothetical protein
MIKIEVDERKKEARKPRKEGKRKGMQRNKMMIMRKETAKGGPLGRVLRERRTGRFV